MSQKVEPRTKKTRMLNDTRKRMHIYYYKWSEKCCVPVAKNKNAEKKRNFNWINQIWEFGACHFHIFHPGQTGEFIIWREDTQRSAQRNGYSLGRIPSKKRNKIHWRPTKERRDKKRKMRFRAFRSFIVLNGLHIILWHFAFCTTRK